MCARARARARVCVCVCMCVLLFYSVVLPTLCRSPKKDLKVIDKEYKGSMHVDVKDQM